MDTQAALGVLARLLHCKPSAPLDCVPLLGPTQGHGLAARAVCTTVQAIDAVLCGVCEFDRVLPAHGACSSAQACLRMRGLRTSAR